ncbi:MAG: amidophosphoribosyltransferase [Zetaproteobacteria bacterium]|nr:amidophosphoribosyltransferase [Zetaproteobacteria bacterium]
MYKLSDFKDLNEECGVFAITGVEDAAHLVYLGLYALQHRGQEAFGMCATAVQEGESWVKATKDFGLVADGMSSAKLSQLQGSTCLGHVRYSTQGGRLSENIQPFVFRLPQLGQIAMAHNGNLTNALELREQLERAGSVFTSTSDSEVFIHLLARSNAQSLGDKIAGLMYQVKGAYALCFAAGDHLYAVRDPYGFRPLVIGQLDGKSVIASETCALDLIGAETVREVYPGEMICMGPDGQFDSTFPMGRDTRPAFCAFESIYFARPDSQRNGESFYQVRFRIGQRLACDFLPEDADTVVPVPDSGVPMAMGFAHEAGLPMELGLVRNHYVGRTFIEPGQMNRDFKVKLKLSPVQSVLNGKSVVLIDDSVVRGTTCMRIVRMIREAGAKKIHLRIGSPPITHPCHYGVATPSKKDLLAANLSVDEIARRLEVDSLQYISQPGLRLALGDQTQQGFCYACFDGDYREYIEKKAYQEQ